MHQRTFSKNMKETPRHNGKFIFTIKLLLALINLVHYIYVLYTGEITFLWSAKSLWWSPVLIILLKVDFSFDLEVLYVLQQVNISLNADVRRLKQTREERDQFDEASSQMIFSLKAKVLILFLIDPVSVFFQLYFYEIDDWCLLYWSAWCFVFFWHWNRRMNFQNLLPHVTWSLV